jgi:hypothetical protein
MAINKRKRMIDEVDQGPNEEEDEEDEESGGKKDALEKYHNPSDEAKQRITDDGTHLTPQALRYVNNMKLTTSRSNPIRD